MTRRILRPSLLAAALFAAIPVTAQPAGVTLYEGARFSGERVTFDKDVFDLNDTSFGARRASSVDVARGCRVTLFELSGYRGRSLELTERDNDLGDTPLGRRSVASLRVECRAAGVLGGGWGSGSRDRGVTLFRDADLEGPSQTFDEDVPDLERSQLGARRASSIEVPSGCVATLFSEPDYRGRSTTFRETDNNLRNTDVGNDTASSLRVDCGTRPRRPRPLGNRPLGGGGVAGGATLFADKDFRGLSETFGSDVPDLARTRVGARSASSIQVSPGCRVTLFSEPNYRGRTATFTAEHSNLRNAPIGNDAAQSLRLECSQQGY
jgi:hypothetical protein